jgi:hypothetical protein
MASAPKVVPLRSPGGTLPAELREFLDDVIVPSLMERYFAESEKSCASKLAVGILRSKADPRATRRHRE